nr:MAG TPA: chromodomain protein [Caudoviricetes sp.]
MYRIGDNVSVFRKVYNAMGYAMFKWDEAKIINVDVNDEYFPYRVRFYSDRNTDWFSESAVKKISGIKV